MNYGGKIDSYALVILLAVPVLLFIIFPAHAERPFDFALERFLNEYLFGNGYYKPSAYPFASKAVNSLSVVFTVLLAVSVGIFHRADIVPPPKNLFLAAIVVWGGTVFMLWTSICHQEFAVNTRRSFGRTEEFHNIFFLYLLFMFMKNMTIYAGIRSFTTYIVYKLSPAKKIGRQKWVADE